MGKIFQGRINRLQYFLLQIILIVTVFVLFFLIMTLGINTKYIFIILILSFLTLQTSITIRRFHDFDHSGYFTFLLLIPIVGMVFSLILLFKKGDLSDNQYGPAIYKSSLYDTLLNK